MSAQRALRHHWGSAGAIMLATLAAVRVLASCASPQTPAPEAKAPPAWAAGLTIGDPEAPGADDSVAYGAGLAERTGDEDDIEPIDFPTCEEARDSHADVVSFDGSTDGDPPDLNEEQFGAILNRGSYLHYCGVPSSSDVTVCAAVINGEAVGVTVELVPHDQRIVNCVVEAVRDLSFPGHPRLDIARTRFAGR